MPDFDPAMARQAEEKAIAIAALGGALAAIEEQRREPDHWERAHLMHGISLAFSGRYDQAADEAKRALTPHDEPGDMAADRDDSFVDMFDAMLLRSKLEDAALRPLQRKRGLTAGAAERQRDSTEAAPDHTVGMSIWTAISVIVATATFVFDCAFDTPIAAGLLYVPLVAFGSRSRRPGAVWAFAGVAIFLTIVGSFLPTLSTNPVTLLNRGLSVTVIVASAWILTNRRPQSETDSMRSVRFG